MMTEDGYMRVGPWRIWATGLVMLVLALILAGCGAEPNQWQNVGPSNAQISALAADPHQRGLIFAGASDGTTYLARGDRSGVFVESEKSPGGGTPVNVIFPDPYTRGRVYAGTARGFYSSSDYGNNYAPHSSGLPSSANVTAITTGADATTLFASVAVKGLYTSADGGKSWKAVTPAAASAATVSLPASGTVQALLWDDASKVLYAAVSDAGQGVYVSRDQGASWTASSEGLPAKSDVFSLLQLASGGVEPSGTTIYAGTTAGLFARSSATSAWERIGTGLPSGAIYSLATYPGTPGLLYAGTDKTVYTSNDGGQHWKQVADGLSHQVPAIVVVPGQNTPTVTYAAAGQVSRYPAGSGGGGGFLSMLILVVIVVSAGWYVLAHWGFVPGIREIRRRLAQRKNRAE